MPCRGKKSQCQCAAQSAALASDTSELAAKHTAILKMQPCLDNGGRRDPKPFSYLGIVGNLICEEEHYDQGYRRKAKLRSSNRCHAGLCGGAGNLDNERSGLFRRRGQAVDGAGSNALGRYGRRTHSEERLTAPSIFAAKAERGYSARLFTRTKRSRAAT